MFEGSMVAIVTPFKKGKVDEKALKSLIEWHIKSGTHAIVPCGTTGESATLGFDEHIRVMELTVQTVKGRIPVIAGTGANATDEAVFLTKKAREVGADGALVVSPYYNKPTADGLFQHYKKIADSVKGFPLILYNVPGRTAQNVPPAVVERIADGCKNVVGIKEATGNMQQVTELIRRCGSRFAVYSGDDFTNLPLFVLGGKGSISVTANITPAECSQMWNAWDGGNLDAARKIHYQLDELNSAMFFETNPIPVKTALALMGLVQEEFRLPLCRMSEEPRKRLVTVMKKYKLI